jgi:hypothetical protein
MKKLEVIIYYVNVFINTHENRDTNSKNISAKFEREKFLYSDTNFGWQKAF